MKVVYLSGSADLGGAERILLLMLRGKEGGPRDCVVAPSDGPLLDRARALGAEARVVAMPGEIAALGDSGGSSRVLGLLRGALGAGAAVRGYLARLRGALVEEAPSLVHTNGMKLHLLAPMATATPIVWHLHDFVGDRAVMARALRWSMRPPVARIVAISEAVAADARMLLGPKAPPVDVVLNAVDTDHFAPGYAPPHDGVRVGLVATYARWKGHDLFLEAAAKVRNPDVRFVIAGGPIYRSKGSQWSADELRTLAERLDIPVHFEGFQQDTAPLYRSLDIVVHASTRREPFGLTIMEAMSSGRAVIAMREGGAAELFTPGSDALGVTPRDPAALAAAIEELARDPERRARLGDAARQTAIARFGRARFEREIATVHERASRTPGHEGASA